jgi:hypothetical protein
MKFIITSTSGDIPSSIIRDVKHLVLEKIDGNESHVADLDSLEDLIALVRSSGYNCIIYPRGSITNIVMDNGAIKVDPFYHTIEIYNDYRE